MSQVTKPASKILFAKQRIKEADLSRRGFLSPGRRGLRQPGSCRTEVQECSDERNLREILLFIKLDLLGYVSDLWWMLVVVC